jgi:hypothetical protein
MSYPKPTIQQGWECPKCGRIYSPTTPMCSHCPQEIKPSVSTNDLANRAYTIPGLHNFVASQENALKCALCGAYEKVHAIFTFTN